MGNFIQWQQVGSDQGASAVSPNLLHCERGEGAEYTLLTVSSFVCDCPVHQTMADTDYKDQISELRCWTEKTWAPKYSINLLPRNQTSHEQYAAVAEDIFRFRLVLLLSKLQQSSS